MQQKYPSKWWYRDVFRQWNKTFKELKSKSQKLNLDSMSSNNILQNEDDTDMFSDILKVFNYQLKCTTKNAKGNISDIRKMIPDGDVSLNMRMKSISKSKYVTDMTFFNFSHGPQRIVSINDGLHIKRGPSNHDKARKFLLPRDTLAILML